MYGPAPTSSNASAQGTDASTSRGTNLPYGGTLNVKSTTWTQLVASSARHANGFVVMFNIPTAADFVVDIAIGASGSETIIAADLLVSNQTGNASKGCAFFIPVPIPSGTSISARTAAATASATVKVSVMLMSELPGRMPPYAKLTTYGARLTGGVNIDPGAVANTKGAFAAVGTASREIHGIMFAIGGQQNTARSAADHRLDVNYDRGGGSAVVVADFCFQQDSTGDTLNPCVSPWFPMSLPSGGTINVRGAANTTDATDRLFDVVIYTLD